MMMIIIIIIIIIILLIIYDKQIHILLSVVSYGSSLEQFQAARCPN